MEDAFHSNFDSVVVPTLGTRGNGEKRRLLTYRSHIGTGVNPQAATRARQAPSLVLSTLLPATAARGPSAARWVEDQPREIITGRGSSRRFPAPFQPCPQSRSITGGSR
jgi:hypothetical protein